MELGDLCGSLLTKASRIQWMGTGRALTIYRRCYNHEGYAKKSDLEIIIREHWLATCENAKKVHPTYGLPCSFMSEVGDIYVAFTFVGSIKVSRRLFQSDRLFINL